MDKPAAPSRADLLDGFLPPYFSAPPMKPMSVPAAAPLAQPPLGRPATAASAPAPMRPKLPIPTVRSLVSKCVPEVGHAAMLRACLIAVGGAELFNTISFSVIWFVRVPGFGLTFLSLLRSIVHLCTIAVAYVTWTHASRFDSHITLHGLSLHSLYCLYMAAGLPQTGSAGAVWWQAHFAMARPGTSLVCLACALVWLAAAAFTGIVYFRLRRPPGGGS
ncbi:hypothetical protein AMAG_06177 [Allomyces macrogynus ATCC 38327]|uniref:Uncharacterized protein n=1 Tax=Allomyces macrogynus (strain ATCC 38327) TaxID=578462 RepID=A0A0L0SFQ3_ALLM3|nr:hypothetical protein AMAG_06177 [Allomyces macrogynus ATCC 38327]|eukprot:KNE61348.1 hypothetical protein AMAG_06177 [Allomyces macrogynus ATCC 38327]